MLDLGAFPLLRQHQRRALPGPENEPVSRFDLQQQRALERLEGLPVVLSIRLPVNVPVDVETLMADTTELPSPWDCNFATCAFSTRTDGGANSEPTALPASVNPPG